MKRHLAIGLILLVLQGCKPKPAVSPAGDPSTASNSVPVDAPPPPDPANLGAITGTIHLNGKPPAPVKIDTSMDPACGLGGAPDFNSEQYVVRDGKLANVYIYVKSSPGMITAFVGKPLAPVVLDQKGCRYTPHVIALQRGDSVEFRNSDVTMHNIHSMPTTVGTETIDISQGPKGAPIVKQFKEAETMLPVRCNNHPWMNAFINISATPFFAVSDTEGHFEIRGLPAGNYVLGAVHEKLGEQTLHVTVPAKGTAKADVSFTIK